MPVNTRPLVIVDRFPLPAVTGGRQRMWNFLLAIDTIGPADLIVLEQGTDASLALIASALPAWSVKAVRIPKRRSSRLGRAVLSFVGRTPSSFTKLDLLATTDSVRALAGRRQLVVAIQPVAAAVARGLRSSSDSLVADLWDIESARFQRLVEARQTKDRRRFPLWCWDEVRDRSDARAWRRFDQQLMDFADVVTVCSEVDRELLPHRDRVWVVPNGADALDKRYERHPTTPPIILYHGQLTYPPNVEAATLLVEQVLPLVRLAVPDAIVRLVGKADERVSHPHAPPLVTVTGLVERIEPELERAAVLVVPLRVGGGTRLKILEAFAAGIPVVSTSIGAEGLSVAHDTHLLIADDIAALAASTVRVLSDEELVERLTSAAHELVTSTYDWTIVRATLSARLSRLAADR